VCVHAEYPFAQCPQTQSLFASVCAPNIPKKRTHNLDQKGSHRGNRNTHMRSRRKTTGSPQVRETQMQRLAQTLESDDNFILSGLGRPGGGAPLSSNVYGERGTPSQQQPPHRHNTGRNVPGDSYTAPGRTRGGVPWGHETAPLPSGGRLLATCRRDLLGCILKSHCFECCLRACVRMCGA